MEGTRIDDRLLSTGEAAAMLGVSRQHVVDLCKRGALSHHVVGTHRRIPMSAIESMMKPAVRHEEERARWLHGVVAGRLLMDPDHVLSIARRNLAKLRSIHPDGTAARYLGEWDRLMRQGVDPVYRALTSDSPQAVELQQNSPFAGVLSESERLQVLASFQDHWRSEHGR